MSEPRSAQPIRSRYGDLNPRSYKRYRTATAAAPMADPSVANAANEGISADRQAKVRWIIRPEAGQTYSVGLYRWVGEYRSDGDLAHGGFWALESTTVVGVAGTDSILTQETGGDLLACRVYAIVGGGTVEIYYKGAGG